MSYEELWRVWKAERESAGLQRLPGSFYKEVGDYVKKMEMEQRSVNKGSIKERLISAELRRVNTMLLKLIKIRYKKTREGAEGAVFNVCEEEKEVFRKLESQRDFRSLLDVLLNREGGRSRILVRFLKEVPSFIGADMQKYGPFKIEDVVYLPAENVNILLREGVSTKVEIK